VFVSLDRDDASFNEYFQKMPWASLPFDNESSTVKKNLSESLKVSGIPSLVVLDAKTGYFITDNAKLEISNLGKELINGGSALIASWKEMVAVDIKEGVFSNEAKGGIIANIVSSGLRNPLYLVGLYYIIRNFFQYLKDMSK